MVKTYTDPSSGEPNVPPYTEAAGSPRSATGVTSDTFSLSEAADYWLVEAEIEDVSGNSNQIDIRFNGDSGANYNNIGNDDTRRTGDSSAIAVATVNPNSTITLTFKVEGTFAGNCSGFKPVSNSEAGSTIGWDNTAITSPLNSITILGLYSFDVTWTVYRRDIGPGGEP